MENDIFWYEIGSGIGELGGHPHQRLPGVPPFRGQEQGVNHVGWFISVIIHEDEVYPWTRWYTRRSFAPGACPWSMFQEQNPSCVLASIPTDFEIVICNFTRPFRNITQGIYAEYHVQIILLFVYTTTVAVAGGRTWRWDCRKKKNANSWKCYSNLAAALFTVFSKK